VEGTLLALGGSDGGSAGGKSGENKKRRASTVIAVGGGSNNHNDNNNNGHRSAATKRRHSAFEGAGSDAFEASSPISEESSSQQSANSDTADQPLVAPVTINSGGGMLNASLRNRYKDVQRERDHQAATNTGLDRNHNNATRALEESQGKNDGLTLPSVVVTLEDNANIDPSGTVSPPKESTDNITTKKLAANSNTATPKKKKRSKKTPSKSSANNHRTQDEGEAGPYSSNNAALLQPSPRPTMLRPGRLDKLLYVPLPSPSDRYSILRALSTKIKLGPDVDLRAIAHDPHANGFSGADCAALLREAGLAVLRDGMLRRTSSAHPESPERTTNAPPSTITDGNINKVVEKEAAPLKITAHHFKYAFEHVLPSVSKRDHARYDKLRDRMARARTRGSGSTTEDVGGKGDDVSDGVDRLLVPPPLQGSTNE